MANELVVSGFNITYSKGGARVTIPVSQASITVAGTVIAQGIVSVGTSAEAVVELPASLGMCYLRNLDATNYVEFGEANTALGGGKLSSSTAGRNWAWYPPNGTTLYLKANTAACDVQYVVFSA
jgi:hypothetical protein